MDKREQPKRIQRKRTKGWRMPENTVYVGRGSKWGNPFRVGGLFKVGDFDSRTRFRMSWCECLDESFNDGTFTLIDTNDKAVEFYKSLIKNHPPKDLNLLKGKDLACWCKEDEPCHADILLDMAKTSK